MALEILNFIESSSSEAPIQLDTHVKLLDFASKMGFTGNMDIKIFKKLCSGKMASKFEYLMASIHPAPEVEEREKNEFLRRIKQVDVIPRTSTPLFDRVKEKRELEACLLQKIEVMQKKASEVQELKEKMFKLCNETQHRVSQNEDLKMKTALLKMLKSVLRTRVNQCEDLVTKTSKLARFGLEHEEGRTNVADVLHECQTLVGSFQQHYWKLYSEHDGSLDSQNASELQEVKSYLKDSIRKHIAPFSTEEFLEGAVLILQELTTQLQSLVARVDLETEAQNLRMKHDLPTNGSCNPGLMDLFTLHQRYDAEFSQRSKICASKQKQLAAVKQKLLDNVQDLTPPSVSSLNSSLKKKLIEARILYKVRTSKNKFILEDLEKMQTCARELNYYRWILEKRRDDIRALETKSASLMSFIVQNRNKAQKFQLEPEKVLSKLKNLEVDHIQKLQQSISKLNNTLKEEIKLFLDSPLYLFHHTTLPDDSQVPTYKMLVNSAYLGGTEKNHPCCGTSARPEDAVLKLFQEKTYCSMLQLAEYDSQDLKLAPVQPRVPVEQYKELLQSDVLERCNFMQGALQEFWDSFESDREELQNCFYAWEQLPFTSILPAEECVEGKTYTQWMKELDVFMSLLEHEGPSSSVRLRDLSS